MTLLVDIIAKSLSLYNLKYVDSGKSQLGLSTRVAVGKEFQFPSPSHSHRVSVGIPMGIPTWESYGFSHGNSPVEIL